MRTVSRLGIFGLGVVAVFGLAAATGDALGPIHVGTSGSHSAADHTNTVSPTDNIDGYKVVMSGAPIVGSSSIEFEVSRDGKTIKPDPYLGAAGHLVVIRTGDLGYVHVHPMNSIGAVVRFAAEFPTPGTYRLFLDFSTDNAVRTASFTIEVPAA